jgi:hypothetical protein
MHASDKPDSRRLRTIMAGLAMRAAEHREVIGSPQIVTFQAAQTTKSVMRQRAPRFVRELWFSKGLDRGNKV